MTNPAEKKQLNTHGHETRRFTHVKPTKPALETTKPMGTAAEKIRQVVQDHIRFLSYGTEAAEMFEPEQLVINALTARNLGKVLAQQMLDAIIEEMEEDIKNEDHKYTWNAVDGAYVTGYVDALKKQIRVLKEARTSITNRTHE